MAVWDPIDPEDVVDLWLNCGAAKPFIPAGQTVTALTVTVPAEVNLVNDGIDGDRLLRIRVGPCESGQHTVNFHMTTDTGEEFNADATLTVKDRVVK